VEEPPGAGAAEREAAALLRENLFGGMETSWDDLLREACLAIYYGFRTPEIVWEERRGLIAVRTIASRNPELVERWLYDAEGRLVGFLYVGQRPRGEGLTDTASASASTYERVAVPLEKTLHFCYDSENGNPQGFGLWRSMYQHWYVLQALYKVLAIGIERNLLDVPVGKLAAGAQAEDRSRLLTILKRWRAAEDAAVVLTEGQEIEFIGGERPLMDAMPFLLHHDAKMLQAGLAQFLNLGQTERGSQSLGTVLARTFETSEDACARWIAGTVNTQLVRRWCRLNYGEALRPPVVRHKAIRGADLAVWSAALGTLLSGGMLHPSPDDEEYLRDLLELPTAPAEQHRSKSA
jgi:phage gp29-like protein